MFWFSDLYYFPGNGQVYELTLTCHSSHVDANDLFHFTSVSKQNQIICISSTSSSTSSISLVIGTGL